MQRKGPNGRSHLGSPAAIRPFPLSAAADQEPETASTVGAARKALNMESAAQRAPKNIISIAHIYDKEKKGD